MMKRPRSSHRGLWPTALNVDVRVEIGEAWGEGLGKKIPPASGSIQDPSKIEIDQKPYYGHKDKQPPRPSLDYGRLQGRRLDSSKKGVIVGGLFFSYTSKRDVGWGWKVGDHAKQDIRPLSLMNRKPSREKKSQDERGGSY